METPRTIGLFGAILIGVGAIVGGGFLALAGAAFEATGPSALVAFTLNAVIAVMTALSLAELSTIFPVSGGLYTFAKKVLSIQAAFVVGWLVWFASIVAAVLYAVGFAVYTAAALALLVDAPAWLTEYPGETGLALLATGYYTWDLTRRKAGGGQGETIGKMVVFGILIAGGLWALPSLPVQELGERLTPFFPHGASGLFQAMGFTFIALQGFDLIAAVAGEVKDPTRNLPRAMLFSLGAALAVYLPLLFLVSTVGLEAGQSVDTLGRQHPETVVAIAARRFMGETGFWLVVGAAILAMLSALQANLLAASRVAQAMALDRTLSHRFAEVHPDSKIPVNAVLLSSGIVGCLLIVLYDVGNAGSAASLIFLLSFALIHWISLLARPRLGQRPGSFRVPFYPYLQAVGALACVTLALFQGVQVPAAGGIALAWLAVGAFLYVSRFERRARVVDAAAEALDPDLLRMRGRSPLVLVPIANPDNARAMVKTATALSSPEVGKVLLLSVVTAPERLQDTQSILAQALTVSFEADLNPEALTTRAEDPWKEIARVAAEHRCESLLLGLTRLDHTRTKLEELVSAVSSDVIILRAPTDWKLDRVERILVPVSGFGVHDALRARLLSSLSRSRRLEVTYLKVLAAGEDKNEARRLLNKLALDEHPGENRLELVADQPVQKALVERAREADLMVMGLQATEGRNFLGELPLSVARATDTALLLLGHHRRQGSQRGGRKTLS